MKLINRIKRYFTEIDYPILGKSTLEVLWLTLIAFLPLMINIVIVWINKDSFSEAAKEKILPGEMLAYSLSFIAPSLYLIVKLQGTQYKLPHLHAFSFITTGIYALILTLYLIAKNKWDETINNKQHEIDLYFKLTLIFLAITILLRVYAIYHRANSINWTNRRNQQQEDFNSRFTESLKV